MPRVGPRREHAPKPIKVVLNWGRRYSLWVFNFGLACCAIEFIAASMARHDFIRLGVIPFAPGPRQADLMVVSGTVTDKMAPAVRRLYDQMPEPKYVISFGACSNSGGPYWDSYCVTKGVDTIIPVDVYVPGCPPRPEALLQGIIRLQEKIAAESLSGASIARKYGGGRLATSAEVTRPSIRPDAAAAAVVAGRGDALQPRPGTAPAHPTCRRTPCRRYPLPPYPLLPYPLPPYPLPPYPLLPYRLPRQPFTCRRRSPRHPPSSFPPCSRRRGRCPRCPHRRRPLHRCRVPRR